MTIDTPIYDQLIRDRGGLMPGQLTEKDLKELAEHRAALQLPPPFELEQPAPEEPDEPVTAVLPVVPVLPQDSAAAEEPEVERTQVIEVKTLGELLVRESADAPQEPSEEETGTEEPELTPEEPQEALKADSQATQEMPIPAENSHETQEIITADLAGLVKG